MFTCTSGAFDRVVTTAAQKAFDRETTAPVDPETLMNYRRTLAQYHLHPETKFIGADYTETGQTRRRHIRAFGIDHIGKEANRWEDRFYLGEDPEAQITYAGAR